MLRRLPAALASQVELRTGDVTEPATLPAALVGVDAVVHLVALPRDWNGGADLLRVNLGGTENMLAAMQQAGVRRLVHLGALGVADREELNYAKSKARAETAVRASGLDWTILKPSLLFGPGDGFFNIVAGLVRVPVPLVPVPGNGMSRFQPIHVGDLARCARLALERPETDRRGLRAGRPADLDVPRDHRRRWPARSASDVAWCPCPCPSSAWRPAPWRRSSSASSPSRPTSCASSRSTTWGRSTASSAPSASLPAQWRASSSTCAVRSSSRSPTPAA